jgi:hypothetical protein
MLWSQSPVLAPAALGAPGACQVALLPMCSGTSIDYNEVLVLSKPTRSTWCTFRTLLGVAVLPFDGVQGMICEIF